MAKYLLIGTSEATPGCDEAYHDWYDNQHLADVCALPGVTSGHRYEALPSTPHAPPAENFAIYEIETEDPDAVIAELYRRSRAGLLPGSEAINNTTARLWLFKQR